MQICKTCSHPRRREIEAELQRHDRRNLQMIGWQYGLSIHTLSRHNLAHMADSDRMKSGRASEGALFKPIIAADELGQTRTKKETTFFTEQATNKKRPHPVRFANDPEPTSSEPQPPAIISETWRVNGRDHIVEAAHPDAERAPRREPVIKTGLDFEPDRRPVAVSNWFDG